MLIRALLAFLALPGVVAVAVPLLVLRPRGAGFNPLALIPIAAGAGLLVWCIREFSVAGKGTLAPWEPPRHLVSSGLYRISRNPMYLAVTLILIGWAIGFSSRLLLGYALLVAIVFHLRVLLHEEPSLARTHRDEWKRYSARVPRWIFHSRRAVLLAWLAVLLALPIGGLIYEAIADGVAQKEFAPPGTLVDIGGRRVHMICIGEGEPIVIFVHSGWGSSLSAAQAREQIATRTTVCSYDRSGHGWSDPGPDVASTGSLVRDLAVLQDRAQLSWPFVLVSSSIGGLTAELFARQYPERTAGLVFLDAANSVSLSFRERYSAWVRPAACTAGVVARFGVIRLLDPFNLQSEGDGGRRGSAITYNARPWSQLCAMARGLPDTVREFEQAPPLRADIPLIVLSASTSSGLGPPGVTRFFDVEEFRSVLVDSHQKFAKVSSKGKWAMVPDSEHLIASSNPDAVTDAVLTMLDEIR
jgi:protein-S-isoprenylcysteine O-methyltransferase Ste14/pimeloyl-ACP methyl ester carboxylesterase